MHALREHTTNQLTEESGGAMHRPISSWHILAVVGKATCSHLSVRFTLRNPSCTFPQPVQLHPAGHLACTATAGPVSHNTKTCVHTSRTQPVQLHPAGRLASTASAGPASHDTRTRVRISRLCHPRTIGRNGSSRRLALAGRCG